MPRKQKINYIETTLNGYVTKRIPICDYHPSIDYIDKLIFEDDGVSINYYEDITGDHELLDNFLKEGSNKNIGYESAVGERANFFLEGWLTLELGSNDNLFIGLAIE